jgi:hypothetical protein
MKRFFLFLGLGIMVVGFPLAVGAVELGKVDIHGYLSQGFLKSSDNFYLADTENGSFEFTEIGTNFSTQIGKLRIGTQLLSRDLGDTGNNEVVLDWAVGDYRINDSFGFRAGKIKMPMGFYNQERDVDMLRVSILLPASVYDEGSRELNSTYQGGGFYGFLQSNAIGELDYEAFLGTTSVSTDSVYMKNNEYGLIAILGTMLPDIVLDDFKVTMEYTAGGVVRWNTPLEGLRLGGTYAYREIHVGTALYSQFFPTGQAEYRMTGNSDLWVASLEYIWNDLVLSAEYTQTNIDLLGEIVGMGQSSEVIMRPDGWYAQASYGFNDRFSAGLYYSACYLDRNDRDGEDQVVIGNPDYYAWQKETVPSLRFSIGADWVVKAEAHFVNGTAQVYDFNNPGDKEKDWTLYALKSTFSF